MIIKIIKALIITLIIFPQVLALTEVTIFTSGKEIKISDTLFVEVSIKSDINDKGKVIIPGLENFQIISTSQSKSLNSINGDNTSKLSFNYNLLPKKEGEFIIGPIVVKTGSGEVKSNTAIIKVSGEEIKTEEITNNSSQPSLNSNRSSKDEKKEIKNKIEERNDIYSVNKNLIYGTNNFIYFFFGLLFFIFIFYFILNKYFSKEEKKTKKTIIQTPIISEKILISRELKKLLKISGELTKQEFYSNINVLFRRYFVYIGIKGAEKMSLSELKISDFKVNKSIIDLFENSYLLEFSEEKDTVKDRINIINKLLLILKK